jgi:hypothetical protein
MRRLGHVLLLALGFVAVAAATAAAHPEPNDVDGDGILNQFDNCVNTRNADQKDTDADGPGDRCDPDADGDAVPNPIPYLNPTQVGHDNCPLVANADQTPAPEDPRFGEACYVDSDGDRAPDPLDNCPVIDNPGQDDYDFDRTGDVCDPDDDEDGEFDAVDNCPLVYNWEQADADGDGRGTACDDSETSGGGGPVGTPDSLAPTVRVILARTQRLSALGAGLPVEVRCSEGCAVAGRLTVGRTAARRLGLSGRTTTVAQGSAALAGRGTTYVFMRFKRGVVRRLMRGGAVPASLTLTAADQAGNKLTTTRRVRLRR